MTTDPWDQIFAPPKPEPAPIHAEPMDAEDYVCSGGGAASDGPRP